MKTIFSIVLLSLLIITDFIFSQTITLKGKVYDENKNPVKNLTLRFSTIGSITTTNSGEFIIEMPDNLNSADVETEDKNWTILYPIDSRVIIPADKNSLIKIVVSNKKIPQMIKPEEAAKNFNKLESLLLDIGVAKNELKNLLESYSQKEADFYKLQKDSIRNAILNDKKNEAFKVISKTLLSYVDKVQNSKDDFKLLTQIKIYNKDITENIKQSIEEYNLGYNELNNNKYSFQKDVDDYWKDKDLADSLMETIDYAIDEIHKPYILKLNDYTLDINKIVTGQISGADEIEKLKQNISKGIGSILHELELKIPTLEKKANDLIIKLKDST